MSSHLLFDARTRPTMSGMGLCLVTQFGNVRFSPASILPDGHLSGFTFTSHVTLIFAAESSPEEGIIPMAGARNIPRSAESFKLSH